MDVPLASLMTTLCPSSSSASVWSPASNDWLDWLDWLETKPAPVTVAEELAVVEEVGEAREAGSDDLVESGW